MREGKCTSEGCSLKLSLPELRKIVFGNYKEKYKCKYVSMFAFPALHILTNYKHLYS